MVKIPLHALVVCIVTTSRVIAYQQWWYTFQQCQFVALFACQRDKS